MSEPSDEPASLVGSPAVDPNIFTNYLLKAVPVWLEEELSAANQSNINNLHKLLFDKPVQDSVRKFVSDPQFRSLFIQKSTVKDEDTAVGDAEDEIRGVKYFISNEVYFSSSKMISVVCLKRGPIIEADKSILAQIQIITLGEGSPYETLHSLVSGAVAPYFKSFIKESGRTERDGDKIAPAVEKKIAELEMGLLHLQQNIDIPEITLPIHQVVVQFGFDSAENTPSDCGISDQWAIPAVRDLAGHLKVTEGKNWMTLAKKIGFTIAEIKSKLRYSADPLIAMINLYEQRNGTPEEFKEALHETGREIELGLRPDWYTEPDSSRSPSPSASGSNASSGGFSPARRAYLPSWGLSRTPWKRRERDDDEEPNTSHPMDPLPPKRPRRNFADASETITSSSDEEMDHLTVTATLTDGPKACSKSKSEQGSVKRMIWRDCILL